MKADFSDRSPHFWLRSALLTSHLPGAIGGPACRRISPFRPLRNPSHHATFFLPLPPQPARQRAGRRCQPGPGRRQGGVGHRHRRAQGAGRGAGRRQGRAEGGRLRGRQDPEVRIPERPGQHRHRRPDRPQIRRRAARRDRGHRHPVGASRGGRHQGHPGGLQRRHRPGGRQAGQDLGRLGQQCHRRVRPVAAGQAPGPDQAGAAQCQAGGRDLQPGRGQLGVDHRGPQESHAGRRHDPGGGRRRPHRGRGQRRAKPGRQG